MENLLEVRDLCKYFKTPRGKLHAVDHVDFAIKKGETLGVVGESGCGKSTLGRTLIRLTDADSGEIVFDGKDIMKFSGREMKKMRTQLQIIFQDPYASLDPRMNVLDLICEPMIIHKMLKNDTRRREHALELMDKVGLARRLASAYPHELDGGRRQRIGVARALALNPQFIVCDEPVSALDVSIQAQILNLLMDLQDDMGLTYLFITHDLSVVQHISDNIMVMYLGQCVELAPSDEIFDNPLHPYTKALLSAIPKADLSRRGDDRKIIRGEVSDPIEPKPGCRFSGRCAKCASQCLGKDIPLKEETPGHFVACTLYEQEEI